MLGGSVVFQLGLMAGYVTERLSLDSSEGVLGEQEGEPHKEIWLSSVPQDNVASRFVAVSQPPACHVVSAAPGLVLGALEIALGFCWNEKNL